MKFLMAEKCKLCEIGRKTCYVYEEACFSQMGYLWICHYEPVLKRPSIEWKHTVSPVKKMSQAQLSIKKVMLTVLWDTKKLIIHYFPEKVAIVNNAPYFQPIRQN